MYRAGICVRISVEYACVFDDDGYFDDTTDDTKPLRCAIPV